MDSPLLSTKAKNPASIRGVNETSLIRIAKIVLEDNDHESGMKSFPDGCTWNCYLDRYPDLQRRIKTKESALEHYIKNGVKENRDCNCFNSSSNVNATAPYYDENLDTKDVENGVGTALFPSDCFWSCYVKRYPDLSEHLKTEDEAMNHYINHGILEKKDCRCDRDKKRDLLRKAMPVFHKGRLCGSPAVTEYCKNITCENHEQDEDDISFSDEAVAGCKMLWFSGLKEPIHPNRLDPYMSFYSAAFNSALLNAKDALVPVLILGRSGTTNENSTQHKTFGRWAFASGAKVIYSSKLSFHDHVNIANWTSKDSVSRRSSNFLG